jgi:hypothetical protein
VVLVLGLVVMSGLDVVADMMKASCHIEGTLRNSYSSS